MSHETIQHILTYLIESILTIGFTILWINYAISTTSKEIDSWGGIQPQHEIHTASATTEILVIAGVNTITNRDAKPLNNKLAIELICWQTIKDLNTLLDRFKMSELKEIASELQVKSYRKMKKLELALELLDAYEKAPSFSE
jgi:hypothetical protein